MNDNDQNPSTLKTLYYRTVICGNRKPNFGMNPYFWALSSQARILLEVFIRRKFGERYFSLYSVIFLTFVLGLFPWFVVKVEKIMNRINGVLGSVDSGSSLFGNTAHHAHAQAASSLWTPFISWYVFLGLFLGISIWHERKTERTYQTFNFTRYSLASGEANPVFNTLARLLNVTDLRVACCVLEPLPFLILGFLLCLLHQPLGLLLIPCAIFYGLSQNDEFRRGRHYVLDRIDEMIVGKELSENFRDPTRKSKIIKTPKGKTKEDSLNVLKILTGDPHIATAE